MSLLNLNAEALQSLVNLFPLSLKVVGWYLNRNSGGESVRKDKGRLYMSRDWDKLVSSHQMGIIVKYVPHRDIVINNNPCKVLSTKLGTK